MKIVNHADRMAQDGGVGIDILVDIDAPHELDELARLRVDARAWHRSFRQPDGSPSLLQRRLSAQFRCNLHLGSRNEMTVCFTLRRAHSGPLSR